MKRSRIRHPANDALDPAAPGEGEGTLAERLFHQLTNAILLGELPTGSKISEPALAERYGVSRGPLREALHRLQERHLIVRSANQGARVIEPTPDKLAAIFAVREVMEGLAAREAAARMTDRDLVELAEGVRVHEASLSSGAGLHNALGQADEDFHFRIAKASGNPLLIDLLCNQLYPLLRLYRSREDSLALRERALVEHQRVLAALQDRDGELAEALMRRHIASARLRRMRALEAARDEPKRTS